MNTLLLDSAHTDDQRRQNLYRGQIYLFSPRPAVLRLVALARQMIEAAFHPLDPELAQYHLPVAEYEHILNRLKPQFVNHPESKRILAEVLAEMGCNINETHFDLPRMRSATADNYLTTGIAYAFDPHRDTWFSGPLAQINWWFPIYEVTDENAMTFYPQYFSHPIKNGSLGYDCHEWNRQSKAIARGEIAEDHRKRPMPEEPIDDANQMVIIPPVGSMIVFSGTHLHASIPNHSGRTRFSIDFRTVHCGDVEAHIGAANVDNHCTGTILRDFLHPGTHKTLSEELILSYEQGSPIAGHRELVNI